LACGSDEPFMEAAESKVSLEFPKVKTNLILHAKVWGISGNHEATTISDANGNLSDSSQIQIFYTSEIYYRPNGANTLVVYAPESSFKTLLGTIGHVKLEVISIDNFDRLNELANTYRAKGLSKLSAYDKMSK
jgi:hypothetical protein